MSFEAPGAGRAATTSLLMLKLEARYACERYQLYKQHLERQPEIRAAIVAGSTATS